MALGCCLTHPGVSDQELTEKVIPFFYHEGMEHRVNCRETGLDGMVDTFLGFRKKFASMKVRVRNVVEDLDGSAYVPLSPFSMCEGVH